MLGMEFPECDNGFLVGCGEAGLELLLELALFEISASVGSGVVVIVGVCVRVVGNTTGDPIVGIDVGDVAFEMFVIVVCVSVVFVFKKTSNLIVPKHRNQ